MTKIPSAIEIRDILLTRGNALFPTRFADYLESNNKEIFGLLIQSDTQQYQQLFGNFTANDLSLLNQRFFDAKAGYAVDIQNHFSGFSSNADIFLISEDSLAGGFRTVEALIIHELCHWYINTGLQATTPVFFSDTDIELGCAIHDKTDKHNERLTQHTLEFCKLLSSIADKSIRTFATFNNPEELILAAMQFDIEGGLPISNY